VKHAATDLVPTDEGHDIAAGTWGLFHKPLLSGLAPIIDPPPPLDDKQADDFTASYRASTRAGFEAANLARQVNEYEAAHPKIDGEPVGHGALRGKPVTKQAIPAFDSAEHRARMKSLDERQQPHVATMQRELKRQFQRQQIEVLRALRASKMLGRRKYLALGDIGMYPRMFEEIKQSAGDLFKLEAEIDLFTEAFREMVIAALQDAGQEELRLLDEDGHLPLFEIERPEVQAAIREVLFEMATKTNNTTWLGLSDLIAEAERAGESIPEIAERINAYFGGRKSDYETERIARTTMVGADNAGAMEAYGQSGVVSEVAWLAALDDRVREDHAIAHGQVRRLGESFDVGGESLSYPGDPSGSPGNIINCRCAVQPM